MVKLRDRVEATRPLDMSGSLRAEAQLSLHLRGLNRMLRRSGWEEYRWGEQRWGE
jgi:hypothetical protein